MTTRLTEPVTCTCYKCTQKREADTFKDYVVSFFREVGFIPRNFDRSLRYNNVFIFSEENELKTILPIKAAMEDIKRYNKEALLDKKRKVHCYDCGRLDPPSRTRVLKGMLGERHICKVCSKQRYRRCSVCGYLHLKAESRRAPDGNVICASCFKNLYFKCARCDTIHRQTDAVLFNSRDRLTGLPTKIAVCTGCAVFARTCESCESIVFFTNEQWERHRHMCGSCFSENFGIKSYSYKPSPKLKTDRTEGRVDHHTLFLGVEWELENKSDVKHEYQTEQITNIFKPGFVYYKSDGSLNHGFEIVTHPFSKKHWKNNRELWNTAINTVNRINMKAMPNCGIHVHMTKSAFTPAHLYKFSKFICDPENRDFIIRISQRGGENSYARFHASDCTKKGLIHIGKNKKNDSGARHTAVNATGDNTVEVRIFASTTDKRNFFKNIEFIFAVFEFSNEFGFRDMNVSTFMKWISNRNRSSEYANLYSFLSDKQVWNTNFLNQYFSKKETK